MDVAFGTQLQIGTTSGSVTTFATIAEVTDISGPSISRDSVEGTNHSSGSGYREFKPGLIDGGEIGFSINYDPDADTHASGSAGGILFQLADTDVHPFRLIHPGETTKGWAFSAFLTKFEPKYPIDDKIAADLTLKITGKPVYGTFS